MKKPIKILFTLCCTLALVLISTTLFAQSKKKINKLKTEADEAKTEFLKEDPGLSRFFNNAYGYAVFPNVGKGGLLVGGASGNGIVYEQGTKVALAKLKQLTIGMQAGGQSYKEIIFFETKKDFEKFTTGDFEFAAQASAVIVSAGASVDAKYQEGVAVFTKPKGGLMYEASIGGQKFSYKPF